MNKKKFWITVLLIAIFWGVYIIAVGFNEQGTYKVMTFVGILFMHWSILECVDEIFNRKCKKFPDVNSEKSKFVVVWSDENRKNTADTMRAIGSKLHKEHGIVALPVCSDNRIELYTDTVKVRFITKVDEYRGLKYDKAFGFNNKPYAGPLIEYIVEQHDI